MPGFPWRKASTRIYTLATSRARGIRITHADSPSRQRPRVSAQGKGYYTKDGWDVDSWVDVIAVEYETLIGAYPFVTALRSLPGNGDVDVLDVGCGTSIFPRFLDTTIPHDLHLRCDLLDISASSLSQAADVLRELEHFTVGRTYRALIEDIPATFQGESDRYGAIWAIHSLTTVDLERMNAVYASLRELLAPGGLLFVYQLTAESSYQLLHGSYRARHPHGSDRPAFMESEDSQRILTALGADYEVYPQRFDHEIADDDPELLQKYLRKCILDDEVDARQLFAPLLRVFHDSQRGKYVIPQSVDLIVVSK